MRHRIAICHVTCKDQLWCFSVLLPCYIMSASLIPWTNCSQYCSGHFVVLVCMWLLVNPRECLHLSAGDYIHLCISAYVRMYVHTYNRTVIFIVLAMMYFITQML